MSALPLSSRRRRAPRAQRLALVAALACHASASAQSLPAPSTTTATSAAAVAEDDEGYLDRDRDRPQPRTKRRQAPAAASEPGEGLSGGAILVIGAGTLLSGVGLTIAGAALTFVSVVFPPLAVVVGLVSLACVFGLPAFAGAGLARAFGAKGSKVRDDALLGAVAGLGVGFALGLVSAAAGLLALGALVLVASERTTAGGGLGLAVLPIFGIAASAALTVVATPALMTIGSTVGAVWGASDEVILTDPTLGE
jgi:hypothetical protein